MSTIEANVDLTLARFKVEFNEHASHALDAYKIFQRSGDEWQPLGFVQKFAFEVSVDDPIGKVTVEYAEVPASWKAADR